jgi:hypothetical protein
LEFLFLFLFRALAALGGFAGIVDGGALARDDVGVMRLGVEAQRVPVRVEPQPQVRAARGMGQGQAHQRALLDELELDLVVQAAAASPT